MFYDYFVMLTTQQGGIAPLSNADGELATFESEGDAAAAAQSNMLGEMFGFEVFCRGNGE